MLTTQQKRLVELALNKGFKDTDVALNLGVPNHYVFLHRKMLAINTDVVTLQRHGEWVRLARAGVKVNQIAKLFNVKELSVRMLLSNKKISLRQVREEPSEADRYVSLRDVPDINWFAFLRLP